jgi:hypothetical protein
MVVIFVLLISAFALSGQQKDERDTSSAIDVTTSDSIVSDSIPADSNRQAESKFMAYYFHGNRRCSTCKKLEAYSSEAIEQAFAEKLKNGTLEWRAVNYDEKGNEHFIKDYQLYTKALILSHENGGKELEWKNLDKIWELVGNKDKFISYVQNETRAFLNPDSD